MVALSLAEREEISQWFLEQPRDRFCLLEVSIVIGLTAEDEGTQLERDRLARERAEYLGHLLGSLDSPLRVHFEGSRRPQSATVRSGVVFEVVGLACNPGLAPAYTESSPAAIARLRARHASLAREYQPAARVPSKPQEEHR